MESSMDELLRFKNLVKITINEAVDNLIGSDQESTEDHVRRIQVVYNQLLSNMTCVGDVVAEIYETGKLTHMELESVQHHLPTPIRASEELLKLILRKPRDVYECFLETLRKTQQHHVYQMLIATDECSDTDRQCFSKHSHIIRRHYAWLTENLQPDLGLLALLFEQEVITSREYEDIRSRKDVFKRSEVVLSIISRKSSDLFEKFKEALAKTEQRHVAEKLRNTEEPGVLNDAKRSQHGLNSNTCTSNRTIIGKKPLSKPVPLPKPMRKKETGEQIMISTPQLSILAKRSQFVLCEKLKTLENKLQVDISVKVASMREKKLGPSDDFLRNCLQNILQEIENKEISLTKVAELKEQESKLNAKQKCQSQLLTSKLAEEVRLKEQADSERKQLHQQCENLKHEFQREVRDLKEKLKHEAIEYIKLKATLKNSESVQRKSRDQLMKEKEKLKALELRIIEREQEREVEMAANYSNLEYEEQVKHLSNELVSVRSDNESLKIELKHNSEMSEEARSKLKDMEYIASEKDTLIHSLSDDLASAKQSLVEYQQRSTDYEMKFSDMEEKFRLLEKENEDLKKIKSDKIVYKSKPELKAQLQTAASKEQHNPIFGMTILNDELFLLTKRCQEVEVRNSVLPMSLKRRWKLNDLMRPYDLISCSRNECLYIYDGIARSKYERDQRAVIFRVDPDGKLIKQWKTDRAGRLAIGHIDNVFITLEMEDAIVEYSPEGKLIRKINIALHRPLHFLPYLNGNFLVCHGGQRHSDFRVCILDPVGNIIKSFPGEKPLECEKVLIPQHLLVDADGSVLVFDIANRRIVLLNSKLEFKRELVTENDGLLRPYRALLEGSNGRLFVSDYGFSDEGETTIGRVLVYDIV